MRSGRADLTYEVHLGPWTSRREANEVEVAKQAASRDLVMHMMGIFVARRTDNR